MIDIKSVKTVKIQGQGYLLNGTMSVPKADGNRDYELIKQWIAEGNTIEPEFTEEELAQQAKDKQIAEAKAYLEATDYKVLPDYDGNTDGIIEARAEARALIRQLEGSNV